MIEIKVGEEQQLGIIVTDAYGNVIDAPPTPVWTFSNSLATVDATGLVVAGTTVGSGDVTATIAVGENNISGTETIDILAGDPAFVEIVTVDPPVEEPVV